MPVARADLVDALPHAVAGDRVEPDRRLVEDQQPRRADQGLRELEPADHAAGVGLGEPVGGVGEADASSTSPTRAARSRRGTSKRRANSATFSRPVSAASADSCCGHVARAGGAPPSRRRATSSPKHRDRAGRDGQQRGDAADRGGLARAVGAEQAEDLARRDLEVEPVDRDGLPEGLPQPDAAHRRAHASSRTRFFNAGSAASSAATSSAGIRSNASPTSTPRADRHRPRRLPRGVGEREASGAPVGRIDRAVHHPGRHQLVDQRADGVAARCRLRAAAATPTSGSASTSCRSSDALPAARARQLGPQPSADHPAQALDEAHQLIGRAHASSSLALSAAFAALLCLMVRLASSLTPRQ